MNDCKISIAFPVYNVAAYVERSLCSALEQTFALPYEVLVIDDKGTDNSMDIVRRLQNEHQQGARIRIVEHPHNKGLGEASNTAIDNAKGKYLLFLDSDDRLAPDALQILYTKAEDVHAEVVIGSYQEVNEQGEAGEKHVFADRTIIHPAALVHDYIRHHKEPNIHRWNKLFLLSFLRNNNIRCVHRIMEDSVFDFNMRANAERVVLCHNITLYYLIRENSIMTSVQRTGATDIYAEVYSDIIRQVQEMIRTRYHDIPGIYNYYYQRLYGSLLQLRRTAYTPEQKQLFEQAAQGCNDFVPSVRALDLTRYRFVYLWCKRKKRQDCDTFLQGYANSRKLWGYALRCLLRLL